MWAPSTVLHKKVLVFVQFTVKLNRYSHFCYFHTENLFLITILMNNTKIALAFTLTIYSQRSLTALETLLFLQTGVRAEADDIAAKASDRVTALQQQIELEQAEKAALRAEHATLQGEASALQEEKAALQVASVKLAAELQSLREDRKAFHDKLCSIEVGLRLSSVVLFSTYALEQLGVARLSKKYLIDMHAALPMA